MHVNPVVPMEKEGVRAPETRVTGSHEPSDVGAGNKLGSSVRAI